MMPPVVLKLFPKYVEGVAAAQWMLVAAVFTGATLGRSAILSMKAWKLMTWYQLLASVFVIAGPIIGGVFHPKPLIGLAWDLPWGRRFGVLSRGT